MWGFVKNLVSFGGHARLERAQADYDHALDCYNFARGECARRHEAAQRAADKLHRTTKKAFRTLATACRLAERSSERLLIAQGRVDGTRLLAARSSSSLEGPDGTTGALIGAGTGAALAYGSWTLVSVFGTASTGTAISTLSGAAATNATLAWFGGGAIAAGGAGMAGGLVVLGGLVAAPVFLVSAWSTHKRADQLESAVVELRTVTAANRAETQRLCSLTAELERKTTDVGAAHVELRRAVSSFRRRVQPLGPLSRLWRFIQSRIFGRVHVDEAWHLEALGRAIDDFQRRIGR